MSNRIIPILQQSAKSTLPLPSAVVGNGELQDTLGRGLHDLRISVTDRCNFRCVYCMPREVFDKNYAFLPHHALLTFEEITRVARQLVKHGVTKIRLTGGEPLLRKNLERLVGMLRNIDSPTPLDITLTTNGTLLAQKAQALKEAGLNRVTISLDALDDAVFKRMNDADANVAEVLRGINAAHEVGLGPIKINMVVQAGINEHQVIPMARYFKGSPFVLRFIEYMDVGDTNGWQLNQVVSSQQILALLQQANPEIPLVPLSRSQPGDTAQRWRYADGSGEIGLISSVTQAFCRDCTRLRLSTEGKLYTCLFAAHGHDIRELLRSNTDDAHLSGVLAHIWQQRTDRYSELRGQWTSPQKKVEMSYIGG